MGDVKLLGILEEQHEQELENDIYWQFKHTIIGYQGPLNRNDPIYKDCNHNVAEEWEDGSITHEQLNILVAMCL